VSASSDAGDSGEVPAKPTESRIHHFVGSVGRLLTTLAEMVYTRAELILVELQEWVEGLLSILLWGLVAMFAAGASLLLGALALIFVFWDTHRILVALLVMAAFVLMTIGSAWMVVNKLRAQRMLFAATLQEFAKDRELMKVRS
jgi:uncharacterized membrane protein YqjE